MALQEKGSVAGRPPCSVISRPPLNSQWKSGVTAAVHICQAKKAAAPAATSATEMGSNGVAAGRTRSDVAIVMSSSTQDLASPECPQSALRDG